MVRVRFAPSPTGAPHIGNIRTALFNYLWARHTGGKFILRIEDTDRERYSPDALQALLDSLEWMGINWDEGPEAGGSYGPYFQSERLAIYHKYAEQLVENGWAYWCDCTKERLKEVRARQRAEGSSFQGYDGHCRNRGIESSPDDPNTVLRFKVPRGKEIGFHDFLRGDITFKTDELDDFVLLKSDGYPVYHFAVVVDDHLMEISHIMRAEEWIPSAGKHILLYRALGWQPPEFVHLPMILGPDHTKLSKRHGATSLLDFKKKGYLPNAMFNFLALLGWSPKRKDEIISRNEIIEQFDIKDIGKAAGIFDPEKLLWMNGEYIRAASIPELVKMAVPFLLEWGFIEDGESLCPHGHTYIESVMKALRERLGTLEEIKERGWYFFLDVDKYDPKGVQKHFLKEGAEKRLKAITASLEQLDEWSAEAVEGSIRHLAESAGEKAGIYIHPLRLAVSGMTGGPSAFEILEMLGRERVLIRLEKALKYLQELQDKQTI